jgi:hypothetical protein
MTTVVPLPISPRPDSADALAALTRELTVETELLRDLRAALIAQRSALVADDAVALEEVVNQIGRTLLTVREARRQRNLLAELVAGEPDATLSTVAAGLPTAAADSLRERCRGLHELAIAVGRELAINQAVIRRAIESGEHYLQHLLTVPATEGYQPRGSEARSGLILNQSA